MDELLDIVDDNDDVIGQELRSIIHQRGLQHRGVHVFLFTGDGKLLVQKRSKDRAASPSAWDCSISEHVKAGESYFDAAVRGMEEEMGVTGIDIQPLVTFRMNYGPNDNEISRMYHGMVDPEKVKFDPVEIEKIDYLTSRRLLEMTSEGKEIFCRWFEQMIQWSLGKDSNLQILTTHSSASLFGGD